MFSDNTSKNAEHHATIPEILELELNLKIVSKYCINVTIEPLCSKEIP